MPAPIDSRSAPDRQVERPLLIWDGECGFCRQSVTTLQKWTGARADYATSQLVGTDFPSIPTVDFAREVKLVEPNGKISGGAAAIFKLIATCTTNPILGWPWWCYRTLPGVKTVSEIAYHFVATHREFFSVLVRPFVG